MEKDFLVYKAAAGSGKTFNLARIFIEELIRKDEHSIDAHLKSIMAITFTHKAANEMKDRVLSFLERLSNNEDDDQTAQLLLDQISSNLKMAKEDIAKRCGVALELIMDNFSQLSISTIDSFSHRVVRSFAKELNLHYDFDVSLDYKSWLELAIDRLFDRFGLETKEGKELSKTLIDFFITQFEQGGNWNLKWMLNDFVNKNFDDELHDIYKNHAELNNFDLAKTVKALKEPIVEYQKELKKVGSAAIELLEKHGLTADDFYQKKRGVVGFFEGAARGDDKFKLPNSYVYKAIEEDKWKAAKLSNEADAGIEACKDELAYYVKKLIELKENSNDIQLHELVLDQIHVMALVSFIVKELNLIREEENLLLISDFNLLIADVVKNDPVPFIYERLGERYKHFLLDEFQDTSIKQWHNFVPLFDNAIAGKNRNLIVGDGKQAIYRFRGGEVELFSDLPSIYKADGEVFSTYANNLQREYQSLTLENNFRSAKAIVTFNNLFFEKIKIALAGFAEVYSGLEQKVILENEGYVKCEVLDHELVNDEDLYLHKTLESIQECKADGFSYGEIAVLARKKDNLKEIANFLSENKIDVVSDESLVLKNQEDINLIISVMNYLVQPEDLQIKYFLYRSLIYKYEKGALGDLELIDKKYIPLKRKLNELNLDFDQNELRGLSLLQLAKEIERIFNLNISINAYFATFLDVIDDYVKVNGNQLDGFLEHWQKIDPSISTPENDNAVKLLTIHKAKGLEYPVVIVPFLDWKKRFTRSYEWIDAPESLDIDLPKILIKLTSSLGGTTLEENYEKEKNKSVLDDINLIYVAFTRAMERLYIYTSDQPGTGTIGSEVLSALKAMDEMDDSLILEKGIREKKEKAKKERVSNYYHVEPIPSKARHQNIKVAFEYRKYHSDKKDEALKYGKAVHELFSKIDTQADVKNALEISFNEGIFSATELTILQEKIQRILNIEKVKDWFSGKGEKFLERELVNAHGKILRPDRIVIIDDQVSVIDYKTGLMNEKNLKKYTKQVKEYMEALGAMGYTMVEGYIISMDEEYLISI